jgi:hypothetical protein
MFPTLTSSNEIQDSLEAARAAAYWLHRIPNFPLGEYLDNASKAKERFDWFTGDALNVEDKNGNPLYPARINPIKRTVQIHAWALFGQVSNQMPAMVVPAFAKPRAKNLEDLGPPAEDLLLKFWEENRGRSYQLEGGMLSQIFKGTYYKLRYTPSEFNNGRRTIPVALDRVLPFEVVAYLDPANPYITQEAWVVRKLTRAEAGRLLPGDAPKAAGNAVNFYVEHWLPDKYTIYVNDSPITFQDIRQEELSNPFGVVPIFYAPHVRTGSLFGENTFDHVTHLVKEFNLIAGHIGDAVAAQSHDLLVGINADTASFKKVREGLEILMLANARSFDTTRGEPDVKSIQRQLVTDTMLEQFKELYKQYRRDAAHPAVIDGEDEGSQRSSATLIVRLLSLLSHIDLERIFLGDCLNEVNRTVLAMLKISGKFKITDEHLLLRMYQKFAPALPKDRTQFFQELQLRRQEKLGTLEHILGLIEDIPDPERMAQEVQTEADIAQIRNTRFRSPSANGNGQVDELV